MESLRVTAAPIGGIACDGCLPLDGLLAYAARLRRVGMTGMALRQDEAVEDELLPLARRGAGADWYWAASCADCHWAARDTAHWNKRFDLAEAHRIDWQGKAAKVVYTGGYYKAWHQPLYLLLTDRLVWYAVGDGAAVADLLADVPAVGKKTAMGYGALVDGFTVEPWPHDWSERRDGQPMRPLPLTAAATPGHVGWYGIRAPYWHPAQRRLCAMPTIRFPE